MKPPTSVINGDCVALWLKMALSREVSGFGVALSGSPNLCANFEKNHGQHLVMRNGKTGVVVTLAMGFNNKRS